VELRVVEDFARHGHLEQNGLPELVLEDVVSGMNTAEFVQQATEMPASARCLREHSRPRGMAFLGSVVVRQ
jgi:hypothetical protein